MTLRLMRKQRFFGVQLALLTLLVCFTAGAGNTPSPPRFAVVTTPKGKGEEAEIARSLVPQATKGRYRLILSDAAKSGAEVKKIKDIEQQAEKTVLQAREAALAFNLVLAAQLKRQAADQLLRTELAALDGSLVAGYLLEAGAASVDAGETDLALVYFRKALAVASDIRPGPTISPEANKAFQAALALGPSRLSTPANPTLRSLSTLLKVDGILWISVGRDEAGLVVSEKFLLVGETVSEPETSQHLQAPLKELDAWTDKERQRLNTIISLKLKKEPEPKKPWYKKWWIYAAVGGFIVAGTAAGIGIASALPPKEVDVVVHH